jgi:outer membrane lipoprotein-sorting protein
VIDAFPIPDREKDEQGYSRRRLWIRADNYYAAKAEFYDKDNQLIKTLAPSDLRPIGKTGKVRAFMNTMTSQKGVKTIIKFEEIHIDEGDIDDDTFTLRYVERAR